MEDQSNTRSTRHTWHSDGPTHRRHPSYTNDVVGDGCTLSSKPAVKRLFSNRAQSHDRGLQNGVKTFDGAENEHIADVEGEVSHSAAKRQRSGEWPLPNTNHATPSRPPLRSRASLPNSPNHPRRRLSIQPAYAMMEHRTSSFIEGSMNDRVSAPPPASYTDYEDRMNHFESEQQDSSTRAFARTNSGNFLPRLVDLTVSATAPKTDNQRPMLRFGKNVFSAFNPTNWKLFSRTSKDCSKEVKPARDPAEIQVSQQAYQLHKASNTFRAHTTQSARFPPPKSMTPGATHSLAIPPQRDSGFDNDASNTPTPKAEKRYGRVFESSDVDLDDAVDYSSSPVSRAPNILDNGSPRKKRSSLLFTKPSSIRSSASTSDLPLANDLGLKKMPSKRQIAFEQKLVKKISNLETKLEEARRQLHTSLGGNLATTTMEQLNKTLSERPPVEFGADPPRNTRRGRGRPTKTILATLPSERLLSDYVQPPQDGEQNRKTVFEGKGHLASGGSEVDVSLTTLPEQPVAHELHNSRMCPPSDREVQASEPGPLRAAPIGGELLESQASPIFSDTKAEEVDALQVDRGSDSDDSGLTGITVIHRAKSFGSTDNVEHGLAEEEETMLSPKAEPGSRKGSGKRKTMEDVWDDDYTPTGSNNTAAQESTPRKSILRQYSKKQKISAIDSPTNSTGNMKSFDSHSPKGSFVSSTKHSKRTSASAATPPKTSFTDSPKENFVNNTKFAKRTSITPPKEIKRKSIAQLPAPPSSSFSFVSSKHARPGTPTGKNLSQSIQKRPSIQSLTTASGAKISAPARKAMSPFSREISRPEDEDAIPPVPQLSEEMLKKHRIETGKVKQKTLTVEDIRRQQKAASNASSSHPNQDVARLSIEKEGAAKLAKTDEIKKVNAEKENDDDFKWDDDVF